MSAQPQQHIPEIWYVNTYEVGRGTDLNGKNYRRRIPWSILCFEVSTLPEARAKKQELDDKHIEMNGAHDDEGRGIRIETYIQVSPPKGDTVITS